jgi:hypothetical protein
MRLRNLSDPCKRIAGITNALCAVLTLLLLFGLIGCGTPRSSSPFSPKSINEVRFRDRSQSKYDKDVRVTTAVPTAQEAEAIFGVNLAGREIQPIWIRVENHTDRTFYLVSAAVDPNYFSPIEAAYAVHGGFSQRKQEMQDYFRSMNFRNPVLAHTAISGFIFTNLDEGEKVVQMDLIAHQEFKFFTFFVKVPGMRVDYRGVDFDSLFSEKDIVELSKDELREALENLPCCTTNEDGTEFGDPLNLVIVGTFDEVAAAFARRGWFPAEETYTSAALKTIKSYLFGSRYRYSPVSSLYFDGRDQDFARQKPRHDIHERNHLRLWYSPMRFEGKPVFVGQVSRDIGVRFTTKAWPPVTHKIDPDIDEARNAVLEDLLFSQTLGQVGFVKGVGRATPSKPKTNLTGDPYFTDGLRVVVILEPGPNSLDEVRSLDWETPILFRFDMLGPEETAPWERYPPTEH